MKQKGWPMSLNAYQTLQKKVETPRETEYRLFTQVTRALIEAASLPKTEIARRMDALDWNRRVWSFLASDCYDPNNGLPEQLRAGIISLSIFVGKYTSEIMQKDADIETLIDINRTIMQGLAGQIEANTAA